MTTFQSYFLLVVVILTLYSLINMMLKKQSIREYKYRVSTPSFKAFIILIIIGCIILFISIYRLPAIEKPWFNLLFLLVTSVSFILHLLQKSYICDKGLWYMGYLYKWKDIKAYSWIDTATILFIVKNKIYGNTIEMKIKINPKEKNEINIYLKDNI